ncbi:MAG: ThuA domain-containing protein [Acidobacteria bacterium]|nr:MAG: ThuA domain-containing protein [Acidobacteriota bacterium]
MHMKSLLTITALLLISPLLQTPDLTDQVTAEQRQKIEAALPAKAPAVPARPRKLLVMALNIRDGQVTKGHASIPAGNLALRLMGERTGAYQVTFGDDVNVLRREKLAEFDAICFNNTVGVLTEDPELRKSLLEFVAGGKGFVGIHAAGATFVQWPRYDQFPEFGEMLGGYENGGHPWKPDETIVLRVQDRSHPVNRAFQTDSFEVSDEVFQFQAPYSREKLRVLLSIDTNRSDMNPTRRFLPERFADRDFAISWIKTQGRGRVFYSSLGHNPHIFWNGPVLAHFLAGIQFALGDLKADTTSIPAPRGGQ